MAPNELRSFLASSGGDLTTLLMLVDEALLEAKVSITTQHLERARRVVASRLSERLRPGDETTLESFQQGKVVPADDSALHLVNEGCILAHTPDDWRLHPLLAAPPSPRSVRRQVLDTVRQRLRALVLTDFRCFTHVSLDFSETGWTCLAGINGAGKSSVLQAVSILMLGPGYAKEIGGSFLEGLRRKGQPEAWISGRFESSDGKVTEIAIALDDSPDLIQVVQGEPAFWDHLHAVPFLAYGATRNLSPTAETRHDRLRPEVRQQMTLFDPLTQLSSAEVLLRETPGAERVTTLFAKAMKSIFGNAVLVQTSSSGCSFQVAGASDCVPAMSLPDGFRSSAVWIADLCAAWCRKNPHVTDPSPSDVEALVMIDEIDLHLHPSLQRQLVPKLRETFPRVQWIVTTHSPLVLANFSREELIALDRNAPGGIRHLDREIKGFTADEIYAWLMDTPPSGVAIQQELAKAEAGLPSPELAQILRTSPEVNEARARELVSQSKTLWEDLQPE